MVQDLLRPQVDTNCFWDDGIWDDLLAHIEERRVIPVVGPDLLQVEVDGTTVTLDRFIATQLASKLSLPEEFLPGEPSLNEVVCQLLVDRPKSRQDLYAKVSNVLKEAALKPPAPLLRLAEIRDFDLFVTTTFDSLLEDALNAVRFGGKGKIATERTGGNGEIASIAYEARGSIQDLPCAKEELDRPTVYHLLGRVSATPYRYVISDEDLLEFVCTLQSETRRPPRLFEALQNNHVLILGENFSDWLARFFLRLRTANQRLSDQRTYLEILADSKMRMDPGLVFFLQHFSACTKIFQGGAIEFVDELWRRWQERNPVSDSTQTRPQIQPAAEMPAGAVFISYASEDRNAVQQLVAGLDAAGMDVWYDRERLKPGDAWRHKIQKNIEKCSCFLAVLSRNTERRLEGVFREEWSYALERAKRIHSGETFIIPVVIDDTHEFSAVPDRFEALQSVRQPGGQVTEGFTGTMLETLRKYEARRQAK